MRTNTTSCLAAILLVFGCSYCAGQQSDSNSLPRSTPEKQGISSQAISDFVTAADKQIKTMHSFMLVRNGHVVAETWWAPESADKPHILWSLSKSFTSTAVGLAAADGKLSIDDEVLKFFPDDAPGEPSENLKKMKVRDLLSMSAGHKSEVVLFNKSNWIQAFLSHPVPYEPGSHFQYNTPATFIQSAIVQKVTGETVADYLQPRLFDPLGIEKPKWEKNPQGITIGGYGLYLKTEDIAKFGQLLLQKGKWKGKQIVPSSWIEQATSKQVSNGSNPNSDWNQGYGFQFWQCRHNVFRGDGRDGQFCIVMPDQNAVVAITAKTGDLQGQLNLIWKHLLPAMQDDELPENSTAQSKLHEVLKGLKATR